ncbi:MAG TPA: pyruvate kinase [Nitrosospira sp.]
MNHSGWHRTKIVCTLGPATDPPGVIESLIGSGMDIARVNTSHGDHAGHARRIQRIRQAARESGQPVAILVDLPGPKFRIGDVPGGCRRLAEGESVMLVEEGGHTGDLDIGEAGNSLPVRNPELLEALGAGESVFLADGLIELHVETVVPGRIKCKVVTSGTVRSGSGMNIPESSLEALVPTDDDRRHLEFALVQEAEWVGISFVQSAADILRVRALLPPDTRPLLMAKIEKRKALANLDEIIEASDGVMVARGDLGIETDLAEIPIVQKRIIAAANARARPVVTATQMLESMVEREHPTRAEVTDVANAALDGTDAVMLSAETAIGMFPVHAVAMLDRVLAATEAGYGARMMPDRKSPAVSGPDHDALCLAASRLAANLGARAIIVPVRTMAAALNIARFRPQAPVIVITDCVQLYMSLALVHGVAPLFSEVSGVVGVEAWIARAREWLFAHGLAQPDDRAVLLYASDAGGGESDSLQVVRL